MLQVAFIWGLVGCDSGDNGKVINSIPVCTITKPLSEAEFDVGDITSFTGTATEVAGIKSLNHQPFKKQWKDTMGFELFTKYKQIVTHGEYDSYSII